MRYVMRIENEIKLDYKDVLIRPKRSTLTSRSEVDITRAFSFKDSGQTITSVPIIAANMDGVGTIAMARAFLPHKMLVALHKHYELKVLKKFFESLTHEQAPYVFYTMGIKDTDVERLTALLKIVDEKKIAGICIDVANGYTERFVEFAKRMRDRFPSKILMAGNVVTGEIVEELALAGIDIIKVGIGPGSVCTTRKMTGVGYPQLSAVIECADAAHGIGVRICADGGCQVPGDVAKAFGAGGDFVMIGSMLSGHTESEMKPFQKGGEKYITYYGSSSEDAMLKHSGKIPHYRASEGKSVEVPYKGSVERTLQEILGGLRSACTYVGAQHLKELPKRTTFIRVTQQLNPRYQ
ncbi:MAG: GMP reductase [Candidatus Kaiserbacteria bacterium GW2011_GWB1_52_6]|uniref:GMP reductase n=3 Tax=Candidatus Kaiseribacteriota TaxID=1752734 RepID=A0A0G1ZRA3_9BACT|nr:MAG: GMP reductase [Candidatus Kaiserbacteria bacterium GW2011_GWA2_52_12]KKW28138.1 MAG: GMP reductase [Candidatus Kaiserbacteria bacterium GW2011_GWB1_52_6]KKW30767.1 MAG: GMP reductase [Candidatus Kaiserbacteria bacterium GW2011_GWC2_52_8b]